MDTKRRQKDLETIERWKKAEGVNLEAEAQKARQKLENAGKLRRSPD